MRRGIAFGFCSALLFACAADLRDDVKGVTNNSAVTTSAVATTTTWSNQHLSEVEDDETQTTATTSVDSSPTTTRLQSSDNRQQAAEFWAPYRGTPIPEATFAAPRLALTVNDRRQNRERRIKVTINLRICGTPDP